MHGFVQMKQVGMYGQGRILQLCMYRYGTDSQLYYNDVTRGIIVWSQLAVICEHVSKLGRYGTGSQLSPFWGALIDQKRSPSMNSQPLWPIFDKKFQQKWGRKRAGAKLTPPETSANQRRMMRRGRPTTTASTAARTQVGGPSSIGWRMRTVYYRQKKS